ncbi:YncE family protein [Terracidiphilus sp.]|jgi:YVTN family beta-propeller protein|uniref:YncE family protein n=1 Tax=Terracidiphilus sp. TaxID=1964191 RepID=UPI003C775C2C
MCGLAFTLAGCTSINNNLQVNTLLGKFTTGGTVSVPLSNQPIAGQMQATDSGYDGHSLVGSVTEFSVVTNPSAVINNAEMPAYWNFQWNISNDTCYSPTYPYDQLTSPAVYNNVQVAPNEYEAYWPVQLSDPSQSFTCYQNIPTNPDFAPSEVSPQFALDNALPSTIQVHAFSPIQTAAAATQLNIYNTSFANPATMTADSIASGGASATFPYPTSLPAGAYITTITTGSGTSLTTNGMEPFFIAHNDTTYSSAFGVAVAIPAETVETFTWHATNNGPCAGGATTSTTNYGGSALPLVTLMSEGKLAVGSSSNTISVGTRPTVVIPYNAQGQTVSQSGSCGPSTLTTYSGAQSALVVNTGSNNVSLVSIGEYSYPTGTVSVGTAPVAAAINPAGTYAYIANYGSNTVSEVSLQSVDVTHTISVSAHPTSVAFDSSGNLWVGGQGYLAKINLSTYAVGTTYSLNGTMAGMSYDASEGAFVSTVLQNGNAAYVSKPSLSSGTTGSDAITSSTSAGISYSTTGSISVSSGSSTGTAIVADAAPYASSSIATDLAFPAQNAFNPPIYNSSYSNGDIIASANGTSFTVSSLSTGNILIGGTTPYPIRGVTLTSTMLYLTMPESNSLITLPLQLP